MLLLYFRTVECSYIRWPHVAHVVILPPTEMICVRLANKRHSHIVLMRLQIMLTSTKVAAPFFGGMTSMGL